MSEQTIIGDKLWDEILKAIASAHQKGIDRISERDYITITRGSE